MSSLILFLIAGWIGFCAAMAIIALRFRKLGREAQRDCLPDEHAHEIGIGAGDAFTTHRSASK